VDRGSIPEKSEYRGSIPKRSANRGNIPKASSDRGSNTLESYPFPLMSKEERMSRFREIERKIRGINIEGVMVTGGA
jgi:hypothetical protein